MRENTLRGLPAAPGLAIGFARVLAGPAATAGAVPPERRPLEVQRAHAALAAAAAELDGLADRLAAGGRGDDAEIIRAGVLMAHDPVLVDDVERAVLDGHAAAPALEAATARHAAAIAELDDPTLAARAEDVRSLGRRAVRLAEPDATAPAEPAGAADIVVVADELGPADVAELGPEVVALVLAGGGPTAHAVIVARGLGLPMVVGLGREVLTAPAGEPLVVDGGEGVAVLAPADALARAASEAQDARRAERERGLADRALPAVTRDGHHIRVLVNAATRAELDAGLAAGAEGVGLLRTELAFLEATAWPIEADHRAALAPVLSGLSGHTATVRVLDFGADKTPPFLAGTHERGLELLLARPEALDAQLRAILDAGRDTELRILLPMVESAEHVHAVQAAVARALGALPGATAPLLGAMIETRAAVAAAPAIATAADFLSIGTNDLSHAVLGTDRFGGGAAAAHDPRVLAAMAATARAAAGARVILEVCGEAASEPASVPLLVGLGAHELSVGAARVGAVRGWIRSLRRDDARRIAAAALRAESAADAAALGSELLQAGDAAGERVERDGRVVAVGPEA
jgi:phosphoenolpyruvate-protein kinase (PTS system EI component)